jgi:hypothetical protein
MRAISGDATIVKEESFDQMGDAKAGKRGVENPREAALLSDDGERSRSGPVIAVHS